MAQKKATPLTPNEKISIALKAQHSERLSAISEEANRNLALRPTESWRTITEEHKEAILFRVYGGDTVKQVCEAMGISTGLVNMAAYLDPEGFGKKLAVARSNGAHTQADTLLEIPLRDDLSDASKKLLMDGIKWLASRRNRKDYTDSLQVEQTVTVTTPVMPDWFFGNVVDGQLTDDSDPTI